jgi:hypothetical protein
MWLSLFSISTAVAIGLSVAAIMIEGVGGNQSARN